MTQRLKGKVALITGGGTGIGAATARRFAAAGARAVISGRRTELLEPLAREIGGLAVAGDIGEEAVAQTIVAASVEHFGGLDILVANAGTEFNGSLTDVPLEQWHRVMRTNLDGVMLSARAAIAPMRQRGGGSIVIVSSLGGLVAPPQMVAYVTTKTALIGLMRSIAYDYGADNIRANAICPGWIRTEMAERGFQALATAMNKPVDTVIADIARRSPLRRMGDPSEIAACIEFLASSDASFVTGSTLVADGGNVIVETSTAALGV
jgi:meso-butanediol dehydrogenase / (S,S)-butanediol dehydrogenase / diacetyl reductase